MFLVHVENLHEVEWSSRIESTEMGVSLIIVILVDHFHQPAIAALNMGKLYELNAEINEPSELIAAPSKEFHL